VIIGTKNSAVVEKIEIEKWPYGKALGYPIVSGEPSDRFNYSTEWVNDKVVPSSGAYQWSLAENVDINKGKTIVIKKKKSKLVAHFYTQYSTLGSIREKLWMLFSGWSRHTFYGPWFTQTISV
jgi:hypothetical protein